MKFSQKYNQVIDSQIVNNKIALQRSLYLFNNIFLIMRIKKLLLLVVLSLSSFFAKTQDSLKFPIVGNFAIQYQNVEQNKIFNRVKKFIENIK